MRRLMTDTQTSGGLLIAVALGDAPDFLDAIRTAGDAAAVEEAMKDDGTCLRVV